MNTKTIVIHRRPAISKGLSVMACVGLLSACSSSSNNTPASEVGSENLDARVTSTIIDASDYTKYQYLNLNSGELIVLNEEQAALSDQWHIAFRRASVKLNGGTSGPGRVAGALAIAQEDFYEDSGDADLNVFLNATADQEADHLDPDMDTSALSFISDTYSAAIQGSGETVGTEIDLGWYRYNFISHQTSLNADNWWLLRSSEGTSYAKFHASSFAYDPAAGLDVTFDFEVQATGSSQFSSTASFEAHIDASGGTSCFDFDNDAEVSCDTAIWDIKLEIDGRNWNLWTHSGVSGDGEGGAFGPFNSAQAALYTAGHLSPEGVNIDSHYDTDTSAGIFNDNLWYAYNLQGAHKLWPNYRTYAITTDTDDVAAPRYLLQITNYYSDAGVSGHPNIRYIAVNQD